MVAMNAGNSGYPPSFIFTVTVGGPGIESRAWYQGGCGMVDTRPLLIAQVNGKMQHTQRRLSGTDEYNHIFLKLFRTGEFHLICE